MLHAVEVTLFYLFIFFKFSFSMVINEKSISSISLCCLTCPLMVSWSLYSLWAVSADRVSLLSAFELLAVLTGPGAPPFCFRQWVCGRGLGMGGSLRAATVCVGVWDCSESIHIAHTCTERGCTASQRLCWPGKLQVHAWVALRPS